MAQGLVVLALLAGSAALARWMILSREPLVVAPPKVAPPLVETVTAEAETVRLEVRCHAELAPKRSGTLTSDLAGRVEWIAPELVAGGRAAEGDALVRIEARDHELAVARARAEVAAAAALLAREEADTARALEEWRRERGDEVAPLLARREPQLAEARARAAAADAELARALFDLERTSVRAPYPLCVRRVDVTPGAFVQRGAPLAEIFQTEPLEVHMALTDRELARLDLGAWLEHGAEAQPPPGPELRFRTRVGALEVAFRGALVRFAGELDPVSRMARLVGEVAPESAAPAGLPFAGSFVEVRIAGRVLEDAIRLPRRALVRPGEVLVVDGEGRLFHRAVDAVAGEGDTVVVTRGLAEGERVVVSPLEAPIDGMIVRVDSGDGGTPR